LVYLKVYLRHVIHFIFFTTFDSIYACRLNVCGLIQRTKLIKLERAREIWNEDFSFLRQPNSIPSEVQPSLIVLAVSHLRMYIWAKHKLQTLVLCGSTPYLNIPYFANGFTACVSSD
jgi:hypothetical protein